MKPVGNGADESENWYERDPSFTHRRNSACWPKRGKTARDQSSISAGSPLRITLSIIPSDAIGVSQREQRHRNNLPERCVHFHIPVIRSCTPPAIVNALLADAILSRLKEQNTAYQESCQLTAYPCTTRCLFPACKRAETMTFIPGFFTETSQPTNSG